jgi:hypothetical protein
MIKSPCAGCPDSDMPKCFKDCEKIMQVQNKEAILSMTVVDAGVNRNQQNFYLTNHSVRRGHHISFNR